jgi:hypothetical protein
MSQELEKYNEVMTAMSEMKAREESLQAKVQTVFLLSHQPLFPPPDQGAQSSQSRPHLTTEEFHDKGARVEVQILTSPSLTALSPSLSLL